MNLKELLKKNGYKYERKGREETIITPNIKLNRGYGYFVFLLGVYRAFYGNEWFSIIPILAGLYWILEYESPEYKAININNSVHIIPNGIEIRSNKGRKFYSSEELGDLEINQIFFENKKALTLTSKITNTGEEIIIMRVIDSEKHQTLKNFKAVANRIVDEWV